MKVNELMFSFLTEHKEARERKNKNRCIAYVVSRMHPSSDIKIELLEDMVGEILTMDRAWRKTLEDNSNLRGTDYKEKERLEKKVQKDLGYPVK
jgi:hypothetical protein